MTLSNNKGKQKPNHNRQYRSEYYVKNRAIILLKKRDYNLKNKQRIAEYHKKYYLEHWEEMNQKHREYLKNRKNNIK